MTSETHRVGPGGCESLPPRIDDEPQRFQGLSAQGRLINVSDEDGRWRLARNSAVPALDSFLQRVYYQID